MRTRFCLKKSGQGRLDEIRECIGCNVCYTGDSIATPIRCTQNPTISEEWRRGWHPEKVPPRGTDSTLLIVGAGPSGLEAARILGQRGYQVMLAEAERELGGRVNRETRLPGLSEWVRVRDHRVQQIRAMPNVEVYPDNTIQAGDVFEMGADHIVFATGASWRADGIGLSNIAPLQELGPPEQLFTPDDIMAERLPDGSIVVFDDDHYYMGNVIAERLHSKETPVTLVTPESMVSVWGDYTSEQAQVQRRLLQIGVKIITQHNLSAYDGNKVRLSCVYTDRELNLTADSLVMVTARLPNDSLYQAVRQSMDVATDMSLPQLSCIGDCEAPSIIAGAVYSGHRFARELDTVVDPDNRIKYDRVFFEEH